MIKKLTLLLIIFSGIISDKIIAQQTSVNTGVGAVGEIIIPAQANMRSNFNLMYTVQFERKTIPSPSFWYKVVFTDTSTFQMSIFPLNEKDRYDFYIYKIKDNYNFCAALGEDKIVSCDSAKEKPSSAEAGIKAGLINLKPIKVNAGDAIYVEVIATKGWDGGHMFDFRMSDSASFVVKVENTYKDTTRNELNAINLENDFKNISSKEIQEVFCKTLSSVETEPYHLLYSKKQAAKDSIAFANKSKTAAAGTSGKAAENAAGDKSNQKQESSINVKLKSIVSIFNTMKNKKLSKAANPVYIENYIPEQGLIYKIQVGYFMAQVPPINVFKGLSPVFQEKLPTGMKYSVGAYTNYELASVAKGFVRSIGLTDAFVVAYYNGKRVTIAEAIKYEEQEAVK